MKQRLFSQEPQPLQNRDSQSRNVGALLRAHTEDILEAASSVFFHVFPCRPLGFFRPLLMPVDLCQNNLGEKKRGKSDS